MHKFTIIIVSRTEEL